MTGVRPLAPDDVAAADVMAWTALSRMAAVYGRGEPWPERTSETVERGRYRIAHLLRTDPEGAWVAVDGDAVVGIALSLRRGPMWFLSLLAVDTAQQARGLGRELLDATLKTAEDAPAAWILATPDPKALRRYALAGFAPHPAYQAVGPLDRALVPAGLGVRDGDVLRDRELVESVVTGLRGAPYGPDLDAFVACGQRLLVAEQGGDRGYCWYGPGGIYCLGATTPALARRLLWEGLARLEQPAVELRWLGADQQWAIEVALQARLSLRPGPSSCRRSALGPLTPYLPSGAYG